MLFEIPHGKNIELRATCQDVTGFASGWIRSGEKVTVPDMQLIVHAPFGSRINRAWGLAFRKRFCRGFDFELQASQCLGK